MINVLVNSLVPIFVGLLLGYVAGLRKIVDNKDIRTLITFVMSFAVPCVLFTTIVRAPRQLLWGQGKVAAVLAISYLALYALTYFAARRLGKQTAANSSVLALTLSFPNAAAAGVPLLPAVYGSAASVSVAVAIAVGAVTISPITLAILESDAATGNGLSPAARVGIALRKAVRRPVVWAPVLGVVVAATGLSVPPYIDKTLTLFGSATGGAALFLTGLVVSAQRFSLTWSVFSSVVGKALLQPALCLAVALLVALPVEQTRYAVLIGALPCGFFGIVFGKSFNATPEVAASSLIASTVVGILTLAGWIILASHFH